MTDAGRECKVDDCPNPPRSGSADHCKKHYHRQYRHGSVDKVATSEPTVSLGRRYRRLYLPNHPLAMRNGTVYAHRAALYDKVGPGLHPCHWCGTELGWLPKGDPRHIEPDHLNNIGDDNRPENLVPCCHPCNTTRGLQRRAAALRDAGFWSEHDTVAITDGRRAPVDPAV